MLTGLAHDILITDVGSDCRELLEHSVMGARLPTCSHRPIKPAQIINFSGENFLSLFELPFIKAMKALMSDAASSP